MGAELKAQVRQGRTNSLTMANLPLHEHRLSLFTGFCFCFFQRVCIVPRGSLLYIPLDLALHILFWGCWYNCYCFSNIESH